jgi:hypothetical protein
MQANVNTPENETKMKPNETFWTFRFKMKNHSSIQKPLIHTDL